MKCVFCDKPVDPNGKGVHRKVTGWERVRTSGEGVHPLKDRKFHLEFAHDLCLEVHLRGGQPKEMYEKAELL